jgi:hypothetical protein
MPKTLDEMVDTLGKLDCTNIGDLDAVANYLMAHITMGPASMVRQRHAKDRETIKLVILAYAKMLQDAGVKV